MEYALAKEREAGTQEGRKQQTQRKAERHGTGHGNGDRDERKKTVMPLVTK